MDVIHVPGPPKEAFHKLRPMSDLIKAQINHFKHLEEKLSPTERQQIPQGRITTENDAAIYIVAMTRLLRSAVLPQAKPKTLSIADRKSPALGTTKGLAIAASAPRAKKTGRKTSKSAPKRKK